MVDLSGGFVFVHMYVVEAVGRCQASSIVLEAILLAWKMINNLV